MNKAEEYLTREGLKKLDELSKRGSVSAVAEGMGISRRTLIRWAEKYPEIGKRVSRLCRKNDSGKEADRLVEQALLRRAVGYRVSETTYQPDKNGVMAPVKIVEKDVMPSTSAQFFWLKNRCGYEWNDDGHDDDGDEGGVIVIPPADDDGQR